MFLFLTLIFGSIVWPTVVGFVMIVTIGINALPFVLFFIFIAVALQVGYAVPIFFG